LWVAAELAGFSRGALSAVLAGRTSPTLRTIEKLADALGVKPIDLLKSDAGPVKPRRAKRRR
jgi:transcriptional regulator with XRE-family HTH domain